MARAKNPETSQEDEIQTLSSVPLQALAEAYDDVNERRLALGREIKALEERCGALKDLLIHRMTKEGATATGYKLATFSLKREYEPNVANWSDLYDHITQSGSFDLLYRRVNAKAVKDRWEQDGVNAVPGVQRMPVDKLSRSAVKQSS